MLGPRGGIMKSERVEIAWPFLTVAPRCFVGGGGGGGAWEALPVGAHGWVAFRPGLRVVRLAMLEWNCELYVGLSAMPAPPRAALQLRRGTCLLGLRNGSVCVPSQPRVAWLTHVTTTIRACL